jgi:hypothetical protein
MRNTTFICTNEVRNKKPKIPTNLSARKHSSVISSRTMKSVNLSTCPDVSNTAEGVRFVHSYTEVTLLAILLKIKMSCIPFQAYFLPVQNADAKEKAYLTSVHMQEGRNRKVQQDHYESRSSEQHTFSLLPIHQKIFLGREALQNYNINCS